MKGEVGRPGEGVGCGNDGYGGRIAGGGHGAGPEAGDFRGGNLDALPFDLRVVGVGFAVVIEGQRTRG